LSTRGRLQTGCCQPLPRGRQQRHRAIARTAATPLAGPRIAPPTAAAPPPASSAGPRSRPPRHVVQLGRAPPRALPSRRDPGRPR